VFCIVLTLFLYIRKRPEKAAPNHSYIIFKDYSSQSSKSISLTDSKVDRVVEEKIINKEVEVTENMGQHQEHPQDNTPVATLNFED
jgi:hypothetical protein